MQFFLLIPLVIFFATFKVAYGDESTSDIALGSKKDQEVAAEFETENDEEVDGDAAKYRWLAPLLYDELEERAKKGKKQKQNAGNSSEPSVGSNEEEEEEDKKPKNRKNKGKKKKKGKKKGKKGKKKDTLLIKITEEEQGLWFEPLGCYRDKGPRAWRHPEDRAIEHLAKNLREEIDDWENFMYVITKCAVEAQAAGSSCFAIQFFGECWIGPMACVRYNMYKESKKCYNGVGLHWGNFVYRGRCGSPFGCCKDGAMPAPGPKYAGCPDCRTAVDLLFVVDASGSIGIDKFNMIKGILVNLTRHFSVSAKYARVGIIKYSHRAQRVFSLPRSQRLGFLGLEKKLTNMRYTRGGTRTGKALMMAHKMLTRSRRKFFGQNLKHEQACIVVTDGLTNAKDVPTFNTATAALKSVAHVIAVGVTGKGYGAVKKRQQRAELRQIASSSKDLFYKASFEQVRNHVYPIAKRACPLVYKNPL